MDYRIALDADRRLIGTIPVVELTDAIEIVEGGGVDG